METSFFSRVALLLLILNIFFTLTLSTSLFDSTSDQQSLLALKNGVTFDPNGVLRNNWSSNTSVCYWTGVSCGLKHHRVTALNLSSLGLTGSLAPHLGNLTFLQSLDISSNNFTGFLPAELSHLRRLKEINASANNLGGEIPSWLGALSQLQYIDLNNNSFSGRIPSGIFTNMSELLEIHMTFNKLTGQLPNDTCRNTPRLRIIYVRGNQLSGKIPLSIYQCAELKELSLSMNQFDGNIPTEIGNLSMLTLLSLSKNNLQGSIPTNLNNLPNLQKLYLSSNHLTGQIPPNIWKCKHLESLTFSFNKLSGSIPRGIGNTTMLRELVLDYNHFTGELQQEIGTLPNLQEFGVFGNSLSGSIPPSIFNISSLKILALSFNRFSGTLPSDFGNSLFNLEALYLWGNKLSGPIPASITNASKVTHLDMGNNSFTGSIPNFGDLRLLRTLLLSGNNLSGAESPTQELTFVSSLTNCRYLKYLAVSDNPLNGILPAAIGNFSSSLELLNASQCNLNSGIPSKIGNLSGLISLTLGTNQLSGPIPPTIGKLKQLQSLYLSSNQLVGSIPRDLCGMNNLGELSFAFNMLVGSIPECLGDVKSLREIYLSFNQLNSTIPPNFWSLTDLVSLDLSFNYFTGQLSSQLGNLKTINTLDLSFNHFSGDIPTAIDGCQSLGFLNLSNNIFTASIPKSLENVRGLTTLDLSCNNLSGSIPKSLEELKFLEYLNFSNNKLEGEIPNGGRFGTFTAKSFSHNLALCGWIRFGVEACSKDDGESRKVVRLIKYTAPSLIILVIVVIVRLVLITRRKQKKVAMPTGMIEWRRISYIELERGTSCYSENNLLGRGSCGSVFEATLLDGLKVAVKVFNQQLQRAAKSFDTETEILSRIRHRNLVGIIGCCSNTEFKALILTYMPNGSLDKLLYSSNYCLDLMQRLKIAIDIAAALEYLHHGYNTFPVVHCDVKPSNVLLDEDMTAHLADFGIAKLFEGGEAFVQTQTLATIGYAAPEYGMEGKVSTNGDVYSFGITLLEMFTEKKPTDDMLGEEMSIKEWVSEALHKNAATEIVAAALISREDEHFSAKEKCVSSMFEVAMKCVAISPHERIDMIEAAATLRKIKATFVAATERRGRRPRYALSVSIGDH